MEYYVHAIQPMAGCYNANYRLCTCVAFWEIANYSDYNSAQNKLNYESAIMHSEQDATTTQKNKHTNKQRVHSIVMCFVCLSHMSFAGIWSESSDCNSVYYRMTDDVGQIAFRTNILRQLTRVVRSNMMSIIK